MSNTLPLANGLVIDTTTGQAMLPSTSPDETIAKDKQSDATKHDKGRDRSNRNIRSSMADLPADPKAVTTVGVVWLYYMLGLSDVEIAAASGMRIDQVDMIKGLKLFTQLDDLVLRNFNALRKDDIQHRIDIVASDALSALTEILEDGDVKPATRSRVAMDLLNRGGFAPKQISEHRHVLNGGLRIVHVRETEMPKRMPTIDIDRNAVEDVE